MLRFLASCSKENQLAQPPPTNATTFITYNISQGKHYSDKSNIKVFSGNILNVNVRFDSSAIYRSAHPENQEDINKLVGFSEGPDNHLHSARIGWNWSNDSLRLYAYAYAQGQRDLQFISVVSIGCIVRCKIEAVGNRYHFTVDQKSVDLPRAVKEQAVHGYWQYPYFGGDEVAPHPICIQLEFL